MFFFVKMFLLFVAAVRGASVREFVYSKPLPQFFSGPFSGCAVHTSVVRSKLDCVRRCFGLNYMSVTYTKLGPDVSSCRCRSSGVPASNRRVIFHGTVLSKTCGGNSCSPPSGSFWLGKDCIRNTDCPAQYSLCYNASNTCICIPGYYYSNSCDACVPNCDPASLGRTFLKYNRSCLMGNDNVTDSTPTSQLCGAQCIENIRCLTFDYVQDFQRCDLSYETSLTSHAFTYDCFWPRVVEHHQRMCL